MVGTRIVITAPSLEWALIAARTMTGFATSVIACGAEAGIERTLSPDETLGRPSRRRRPALHHGHRQAPAPAPQPGRPMRADEPGLGLLRRARRREEAEARRFAAVFRRRLADVEDDRGAGGSGASRSWTASSCARQPPVSPRRRLAAAICSCSANRTRRCSPPANAPSRPSPKSRAPSRRSPEASCAPARRSAPNTRVRSPRPTTPIARR